MTDPTPEPAPVPELAPVPVPEPVPAPPALSNDLTGLLALIKELKSNQKNLEVQVSEEPETKGDIAVNVKNEGVSGKQDVGWVATAIFLRDANRRVLEALAEAQKPAVSSSPSSTPNLELEEEKKTTLVEFSVQGQAAESVPLPLDAGQQAQQALSLVLEEADSGKQADPQLVLESSNQLKTIGEKVGYDSAEIGLIPTEPMQAMIYYLAKLFLIIFLNVANYRKENECRQIAQDLNKNLAALKEKDPQAYDKVLASMGEQGKLLGNQEVPSIASIRSKLLKDAKNDDGLYTIKLPGGDPKVLVQTVLDPVSREKSLKEAIKKEPERGLLESIKHFFENGKEADAAAKNSTAHKFKPKTPS